jgi:hypothetical protein
VGNTTPNDHGDSQEARVAREIADGNQGRVSNFQRLAGAILIGA